MTDILSAARDYVARGISVIPLYGPDEPAGEPVDKRGKRPVISWTEYQKKLATDAELVEWFDKKSRNIGIVTGELSGFTVVDFDTPEAIASAKQKGFPKGPLSKTAKGFHALCRYEEGHRNFQKRADLPGIDLRAEGGYIVAPPSIHATGAMYQWLTGRGLKDLPLPAVPEWLLVKDNTGKATIEELHTTTPEGRNISLTRLCGVWINQHPGIDLAGLVEMATAWNTGLTSSPLPTQEVERTCQSIFGINQKNTDNQWPEPLPLPAGLTPVMKLDPAMIPAPLREWLLDIANRMQSPVDYSAAAAIVAAGSVVGRGCGIYPKKHDNWLVVPNLFGAVVGDPSQLKTPAIAEAMRPLKRLEIEAKLEHSKLLAEYLVDAEVMEIQRKAIAENIKKLVKDDPPANVSALRDELAKLQSAEPVRRRYETQDGTTEKIGEILNQNPRGILVNRDELIGWFHALDKAGRESDRGFYLESWNGSGRFTYDRIGRGTLDIDALCISLFGAVTPGPLADYINQTIKGGVGNDGLTQRLQLLVYPDPPREWINVDRYPDTEQKNRAFQIFKALSGDIPGAVQDDDAIPALRFSPAGQEVFDQWRHELETRLRSDNGLHPSLASHLAKYRSLMPSLALIFHLIEVADRTEAPGPVTEHSTIMAAAWCEYLESHAARVYGAGTTPGLEAARQIVKHILRGEIKAGCTVKDIYRNHWSQLTTADDVKAGLAMLAENDWLILDKQTTGGRPSEIIRLNPRIKLL